MIGMTRDQAGSALKTAQLKGQAKYEGGKPQTAKELALFRVSGQNHAAGETLEVGKGVVVVTLSKKADPTGDSPAKSEVLVRDGRYSLEYALFPIATIEWTNNADGSAEFKLISNAIEGIVGEVGIKNVSVFHAVRDEKVASRYLVGGKEFQDIFSELIKDNCAASLLNKWAEKQKTGAPGDVFDRQRKDAYQAVNKAKIQNDIRMVVTAEGGGRRRPGAV